MEEPTKKRGWFQLRFSTVIVLMIFAALLLGLNMKGQTMGYTEFTKGGGIVCGAQFCLGFPFPIVNVLGLVLDLVFFFGTLFAVALVMEKISNSQNA